MKNLNYLFQPVAVIFLVLDFQAKNPELYNDKNDGEQGNTNTIDMTIDANTITRWAMRDDGKMIVATTPDAFPNYDKTTERVEVINLGKNLDGDDVFLATIQDSGKQLDFSTADGRKNAELEAKSFKLVLPEPGSHFGTTAHADNSFSTMGLIYVLDKDGKLKEHILVPDMKKAFSAGEFGGMATVAIETADRVGIVDAMTFVDRVRNDALLLSNEEGKAKEDGETLTRAELDDDKPVMAVKNGNIKYYGANGNRLEKENDAKADVINFPGVNRRGKQTASRRVMVTKTSETSGTIERFAANA